jgi:hypothetical protein
MPAPCAGIRLQVELQRQVPVVGPALSHIALATAAPTASGTGTGRVTPGQWPQALARACVSVPLVVEWPPTQHATCLPMMAHDSVSSRGTECVALPQTRAPHVAPLAAAAAAAKKKKKLCPCGLASAPGQSARVRLQVHGVPHAVYPTPNVCLTSTSCVPR